MKKRIILPILLLTGVLGGVSTASLSAGTSTLLSDDSFENTYSINETLVMPAIGSLYFKNSDGSITKAVHGEIRLPNGEVRTVGTYVLDYAGNYVIKYVDKNGNEYKKEFVVNKNVYEAVGGVTAEYKENLSGSQKSGILLNMPSGGLFRFNKPVNLKTDFDGDINLYNIYPYFRESNKDLPAAYYLSVKLLDAYDYSKFVEFYLWAGSANSESAPYYCGAGAAFQNFTGLEDNPDRPERNNCTYEGKDYYKHIATRYQSIDAYGVWDDFGNNSAMITKGGHSVSYNVSNQTVKIIDQNGTPRNKGFVTDLDSAEIYDKNTLNFDEYFTNGDVIPQIQCFGYNASSIKVEIPYLLGMSGEALKDSIINDNIGPTFKSKYDDKTVYGSLNSKFYIPTDIESFDLNYYKDLKTSVYFNYGKENQIKVESSDCFIPTMMGKYSIIYTATDAYGNKSYYELPVNCVDEKPFVYEENKVNELIAANDNVIPELDVSTLNNGLKVKAYAIDPKGNKQELLLNPGIGYNLAPLYVGAYQIVYEISNDFYVENFAYEVNAVDQNKIYFDSKPAIYPFYMKDARYSFEPLIGKKATVNGPVDVASDIYISFDGGAFTKVDDINDVLINGSNNIKAKYASASFEYITDEITIIDTKYAQKTSLRNYSTYFQGDYTYATDTTVRENGSWPSSITYKFTNSGSMRFINLISLSNFSNEFDLNTTLNSTYEFKLTDYTNDSNYVSLKMKKLSSTSFDVTLIRGNGTNIKDETVRVSTTSSDAKFKLSIENKQFKVMLNSKVVATFEIDYNFDYSIFDVITNATSSYILRSLNGQSFAASASMIESNPLVQIPADTKSFELNSVYVINPCKVTCVLSPILKNNVSLSVTNPNNEIVSDINGLRLENVDAFNVYNIKLAVSGQYRLVYRATAIGSGAKGEKILDTADNLRPSQIVLNVDDTILPVIRFDSYQTVHLHLLEVHKVRNYSISDNLSTGLALKVRIMITDDHFNVVDNGYDVDKYGFTKEGKYYVVAFAIDEAGNYIYTYYEVVVEA